MIWGRRFDAGDPELDDADPVPPMQNEGDPAQALLNVLSRFQRHYLRGKDGAEQSAWSDDCMNSLIDAVDVAVAQRWQEVVSVLTETARVLQTYEDADRANECVAFLASSHEILCHMVGDLLTGQVRPGLVRKWDSLYDRARDDVSAAGLTLVQDEVSDEELAHEAFGVTLNPSSPFEDASDEGEDAFAASHVVNGEPESSRGEPAPFELPELESAVADADALLELDDLPDLAEPGAIAEAVEALEDTTDEAGEDRILSFPRRAGYDAAAVEDGPTDDAAGLEAPDLPFEEAIEIDVAGEIEEPIPSFEPEPVETVVLETTEEDDISGILDAACDALSNVTENLGAFAEQVRELEARAIESEWEGAAAACRSVLRLMEMLESRNIEPTDRFLELAYGFSGVYVESRDSVDTDEYRAFQKDCVGLLQDWMDERAAEHDASEAAAVAPEHVESDDPALTELLATVRTAMAGGKAVNAKLLMLEAAARIAREQEREAEAKVGDAERALSENSRALERARASVQQHEHLVDEGLAKVAEVQQGQEALRRQTAQIAERVEEALSRVVSLDEQIRELQNRRDAAEAERAAAQAELENARAREHDHETSLEAAQSAERDARLRLEEERREAKVLQGNRVELERAVIAQREMLAKQRQSTQDIEQTIAHTRDSESGESAGGNDSLF